MKEDIPTTCYLFPVFLPYEYPPSVQGSLLRAICSKCLSFPVPPTAWPKVFVAYVYWEEVLGWTGIDLPLHMRENGPGDPVEGVLLSQVQSDHFHFEFPLPARDLTLRGSPWCGLICVLYSFICALVLATTRAYKLLKKEKFKKT